MAKNTDHVSHIKSKNKVNGKPQLPPSNKLVEGEIAVNYAENVETLSIKNESGTVVTFSSDNYYTAQKLGSGFTGENSATTVTDVIIANEETVAASLIDLNDRKADLSALTQHISDNDIHLTTTEKENLDSLATNIGAISGITSNKVAKWDTAADVDFSKYYTTAQTSSSTEINTALASKADSSDIPSVENYFDGAVYDSNSKRINFKHGETVKAYIDATDFIKDGMVEDVKIENGNLVISFNTDSGKQDISIPLTSIFNPSNYYDKTATDTLLDNKLDASAYTPTDLTNYYQKTETSGKTEISTALSGKSDTGHTHDDRYYTETELTATTNYKTVRKAYSADTANTVALSGVTNADDLKAIEALTGTSGLLKKTAANTWTLDTTSYSSATQVNTALGNKSDTSHTHAISDVTNLQTTLNGKASSAITVTGASGLTGGGAISGNVTIGHATAFTTTGQTSPNANQNATFGGTVNVPVVKYDKYGHITATATTTITMPSSASSWTNNYYISGATVTTSATKVDVALSGNNAAAKASFTIPSATTTTAGVVKLASTTGTSTANTVMTQSAVTSVIGEMEQTLAAGLSDVNERMAEKSALNSLASTVNDIRTTGISSRRLARKDFTSYGLTWFINTLKKAVADQDLEKYGMKVGDYFTVNHGGKTYNYVIAGLNTMRGSVSSYRVTQSHVGLIVDTNDTHAWNTSGNTYQSTNTYSTEGTWTTGTAGQGYANCDLHYYLTTTVLSNVESDLGSANLLSHYKLYGNSINTTGYNRYGINGGCTNSWGWYANQKICALSEIQVYGSIVWSSSGYDTGEACRQLDVFRVYNMNEIFEGRYPWLRDVASASYACLVDHIGHATAPTADYGNFVAALILFA